MNTATTPDLIAESDYPISATGQFDRGFKYEVRESQV